MFYNGSQGTAYQALGFELVDLTATDWEGSHRAHLEAVPRETTVGQVVGEAVRAMQLPGRTFFQALSRGRELSHDETLDEAGIVTGDELELMPRVSAG